MGTSRGQIREEKIIPFGCIKFGSYHDDIQMAMSKTAETEEMVQGSEDGGLLEGRPAQEMMRSDGQKSVVGRAEGIVACLSLNVFPLFSTKLNPNKSHFFLARLC